MVTVLWYLIHIRGEYVVVLSVPYREFTGTYLMS